MKAIQDFDGTQTCSDCIWWRQIKKTRLGYCHYNPPVVVQNIDQDEGKSWRTVSPQTPYCGFCSYGQFYTDESRQ